MAPFTMNHAKTSQKLRQMIAHGEGRKDILRAVPMNYYPRLDEAYGHDFVRRYLEDQRDFSLIDTFIARGMDVNAQNDEGNTLLHSLMRNSSYQGWAIEEIITHYLHDGSAQGFKISIKNNMDEMPLDVYARHGGGYSRDTFVVPMIFAEAAEMHAIGSANYIRHLHQRFCRFARHFSVTEMQRLLAAEVSYEMQDAKGVPVWMHVLQSGQMNAVTHALNNARIDADKTDAALKTLLTRTDDLSILALLAEKRGYEVAADVVMAAVAKKNIAVLEYLHARHTRHTTNSVQLNTFADRLFDEVLKTANNDFISRAKQSELFKDARFSVDRPVFEGGRSLLLYTIARGYLGAVKEVVEMGADLRRRDDDGKGALDLASREVRPFIEGELRKLNQRGSYERVHDSQISYKTGVLTYIFDFHAGQVVVRDNETKNIASTPIADFAKSGGKLVGEAARVLVDLGGDAQGYEGANDELAVPRRAKLIDKKPGG